MAPGDGLRIAALVKQVPAMDRLELGADNRLLRSGLELEMNPYCRRAVAKGVELARATGGRCVAVTLGPPSAEEVLREAIAWGADEGILVTDPVFAGSDTIATARALSVALYASGPFDLVLVGQNSIDGDTGQVGPQVAQLLDLPYAGPARELDVAAGKLRLRCEREGGWVELATTLPAVVAVAERLCDPCKVKPEGRAAVDASRIRSVSGRQLGRGPWGEPASRTVVGATRPTVVARERCRLDGEVDQLAGAAAAAIRIQMEEGANAAPPRESVASPAPTNGSVVAVLHEPGRASVTRQLLGRAAALAVELGTHVTLVAADDLDATTAWGWGADEIVRADVGEIAEDVASTVDPWLRRAQPSVVLAPGTMWGREVASRLAARTDSGLIGDAVDLEIGDGRLVGWKPAFHGGMLAAITATSQIQMATVRPGVFPVLEPRTGGPGDRPPAQATLAPVHRGRVTLLSREADDDPDALSTAAVVVGIGMGVEPEEYETIEPLRSLLGAELGATRKVTDRGWQPHTRQIGVTGYSIAPRLYIAIGARGNLNHMSGVRNAGYVIAVNDDPAAPVFDFADLGIVADWRTFVPALVEELRRGSQATVPAIPDELDDTYGGLRVRRE